MSYNYMSYNYRNKIIDTEVGSYQDKFFEYASNWEEDEDTESKRVKILLSPNKEEKDENISFEDIINSYIEKNKKQIKIIDIKYQKTSAMIIYEIKPRQNNNN